MFGNLACLLWMASAAAATLPAAVEAEGSLEPGKPATVLTVPATDRARTLAIVVTLKAPGALSPAEPVGSHVEVGGATLSKTLHLGDPDATWLVRQPAGAEIKVGLDAGAGHKGSLPYKATATEVGEPAPDGVAFETEPNDRYQDANPLVLGQTLSGLADDRPYLPLGDAPTDAESHAGLDWFTFEFTEDTPGLAFFGLEFVDKDVPPDVRIYTLSDGKLVEYTRGIDPQAAQRERPPRPGANKFTTRVLTRGRYYVLVDACQPEYQLRTKLFDVPPYLTKAQVRDATAAELASAARKAVRAALDFQLLAGDSWHANTPRKGHPMDRVANPHHETSTCLGCHATHFTTQSAMAAVRAGYKVEEPFALRFLTERLANNPVPFHGYPDAVWARMIPAPANVMGRLSTILIDFENHVAGAPRNNLHRGVAEFLKLYYDGRTALPPDESNGNNPVSRYKVASDAWRQLDEVARRTGEARYAETRDLVAGFLPTGTPANVRDLAAQTIGLCTAGTGNDNDKEPFDDKIKANVGQLLEIQHPDGLWPITLGRGATGAVMQTGESLYALALAGLTAEHPAVRRGVAALLIEQKPFGGWHDLHPYEQFQTPFRETQWSLIALSTLYPAPGIHGWNGPLGPQPERLRGRPDGDSNSDSALIAGLDRVWDAPGPLLDEDIIALSRHASPLVRYAACRALARVGTLTAIGPLGERLGDDSKVVQRAAAEAFRAVGSRFSAARPPGASAEQTALVAALAEALRSADDRVRRGATRVFAGHFRDLAQETALADALLSRLDDPDPVVRVQAIKGLWRWWYWQADWSLRDSIENALIARLAEPAHPWVRRNLIEALYIIGDENIRYLYKNWVPALATQERRDTATAAQHATVNRLGAKYVAVLATGNALQREGVLRAMSEFPERPVLGGRVGNDLEPMLFYDDALPSVAAALADQLGDPDAMIRRLALQALVTLRGDRDPALARAVLLRQGDTDEQVRDWAATMTKEFPLVVQRGQTDPALELTIDDLLKTPVPEAQAAALAVIGRIGPTHDDAGAARAAAVRSRLAADPPRVRAAALRTLATLPALLTEAEVRGAIRQALADPDVEARIAAVKLALDHPGIASDNTLRKALEDPAPDHRIALLAAIGSSRAYSSDLRLVGVVSDALDEENRGVREKALQVIQTYPALVDNPAVAESLSELTRSDNPRQKEMATALLKTRGRSSAAGAGVDRLDLAFFEARVLPIFNRMGEDGQNCVGCHRQHSILKMVPPGRDGRWSPEAVRANFRAALRVVNPARPAESLLLGKPTWEAAEEAEAQTDATRKAHAGGVRFEAGTSEEYQVILDWINGARLKPGSDQAAAAAR
jgi:HEAT repeat protein